MSDSKLRDVAAKVLSLRNTNNAGAYHAAMDELAAALAAVEPVNTGEWDVEAFVAQGSSCTSPKMRERDFANRAYQLGFAAGASKEGRR